MSVCAFILRLIVNLCRHVILPADIAKLVPRTHLLTETEWRNLGVQQSPGWTHYMVHVPGCFSKLFFHLYILWTVAYYISIW